MIFRRFVIMLLCSKTLRRRSWAGGLDGPARTVAGAKKAVKAGALGNRARGPYWLRRSCCRALAAGQAAAQRLGRALAAR